MKPYFLLTLLSILLFLPGINTIPIIDRDSAHFAQATRQMLETGNYFQIRFQEITRFQKPPGINWLQALSVAAFSDASHNTIWPYRIPSFLGGLFAVLLSFSFANRFFGEKCALLAAALLGSSLLLVVESHLAVIDAMLLCTIILMQGALWIIYTEKKNPSYWVLIFWLSLSFGFLLKGVTPLIALLTIGTLVGVDRSYIWLKMLRFQWGIPLFLILNLSWIIPLSIEENSFYLWEMFKKDLLPKLAGGHESHGKPFGTHLAILFLTFWPGSLFLWIAGRYAYQFRKQPAVKFLLAWIIPCWIFYELMPTKLPQYILPTFPALAILTSLALQESPVQGKKALLFWVISSLILGGFLILIPYIINQNLSYFGLGACLLITLIAIAATQAFLKADFKRAAWIVIVGSAFTWAPVFHYLLPSLYPLWISDKVYEVLQPFMPDGINKDRPLLVMGYEEPSLVFKFGTHQVLFVSKGQFEKVLHQTKADYLLINSNLPLPLQNLIPLTTITGYNYNKGQRIKLTIYKIT